MEVSLIFPHQIYEFNPCVTTKRKIYLIEDHLYFTKMKFHKQKLYSIGCYEILRGVSDKIRI